MWAGLADLLDAHPDVGERLHAGHLGVAQAHEIARAHANPRCGRQIGDVLGSLLDEAVVSEFPRPARVGAPLGELADADGAHRDRELRHAGRRASLVEVDGVLHLSATGGAVEAAAMVETPDRFCDAEFAADRESAIARRGESVDASQFDRTHAQRRFDALLAIFERAASTPPDALPPEPVVNTVVDQVTFEEHLERLGLVPANTPHPELALTARRCETTSGIPVSPHDAYQAAILGWVRRVVLDSASVVTNMGRKRRLFTGAAADAVRFQTRRRCYRGCDLSATRCELDHTVDWRHTGATNPANGGPACRRHNQWKNRGFCVHRDADGHWHTYRPDGTEIA